MRKTYGRYNLKVTIKIYDLQFVSLMILFIYYKLKHIFGMFCNKVYFMFDSVKRSSLFYKTSARHT